MNTCFGASLWNYGDRRQILMCVALWVGVLGGSIVRDSPSTSHFEFISPANIVLFGLYWYSEMSVDHGMCALVNISIVNNVATVFIIRKFTASPVNQPIRRLLVSWFPLVVGEATAMLEVTKQADWLICILSISGTSLLEIPALGPWTILVLYINLFRQTDRHDFDPFWHEQKCSLDLSRRRP